MISILLTLMLAAPPQLNRNDFYANATYDPKVPTPEKVLGYKIGQRFTRFADLEKYYEALARSTDRMKIEPYGSTYEGRTLYTLIFSSPENLKRLDEIRASVAKLRDPRVTSESDAQRIAENTPAIAWLAYNVHGNEASSAEACMQVAYQLAAGADRQTLDFLKNLVIVLDPLINPDGRERYVTHFERFSGHLPSDDRNAFERNEAWPGGRTNHYYFDLNRDWAWQTQKESKERVKVYFKWNPQVFVDYHEMGSDSTYFFPPPYKPVNKNLPDVVQKWFPIYAKENAEAMDRIGSRYFTREGYDLFFPSYGDSWPSFNGAIGMTYEQGGGGAGGLEIKRDDGTTLTLRDRALNHFTTSIATLKTTADNRKQRLLDFYQYFKISADQAKIGKVKQYFITQGKDPARTKELIDLLRSQMIEIRITDKETKAPNLFDATGRAVKDKTLPAGTFVIDLNQPAGILAHSLLEKDPEIKDLFFYDITSWSLLMAYGVDGYWSETPVAVTSAPVNANSGKPAGGVVPAGHARTVYAFTYDKNDSVRLLNALLKENFRTTVALKDFRATGTLFPRGSIVVPVEGNPASVHDRIATLATTYGITVHGFQSYRTEDGIDLGSNRVRMVQKPRIALVVDDPTSAGEVGPLWYLLDQEYGIDYTLVRTAQLGGLDLNAYNVLILADDTPRGRGYMNAIPKATQDRIRDWISRGGTFVGIKGGAIFATKKKAGFASIGYHFISDTAETDRVAAEDQNEKVKPPEPSKEEILRRALIPYEEKEDERRTDRVPGSVMRLQVDSSHPLAIGYGNEVTLLNNDSVILDLSEKGDNVVYYPAEGFRMGGFMLPKKNDRLKHTAYLVRERLGRGSVVLYADSPDFRTFWKGGARLFLNSIFFGVVRDPNVE